MCIGALGATSGGNSPTLSRGVWLAGGVSPFRFVVHTVRRVGDHKDRLDAVEQPLGLVVKCGIAAQQPVFAKNPKIPKSGNRIARQIRNGLRIREALNLSWLQDSRQFVLSETGKLEIKVQ